MRFAPAALLLPSLTSITALYVLLNVNLEAKALPPEGGICNELQILMDRAENEDYALYDDNISFIYNDTDGREHQGIGYTEHQGGVGLKNSHWMSRYMFVGERAKGSAQRYIQSIETSRDWMIELDSCPQTGRLVNAEDDYVTFLESVPSGEYYYNYRLITFNIND